MFKTLIVMSEHSETPLAEIRTDGRNLEWVVDNTNGQLPSQASDIDTLYRLVKRSSHLRIEPQKNSTAHILRYLMSNGDVVEITSDAKTCMLNGQLLSHPEKDALFAAISRGEIKVAQKADPSKPIPVMPRFPTQEIRAEQETRRPKYNPKTIQEFDAAQQKDKDEHAGDSVASDSSIEAMNSDGMDPLQAQMAKNMLYYAKYGSYKGGVNA